MGLRLLPDLEAKILSMADPAPVRVRQVVAVPARAIPRHKTGEMNKTEIRFVREVLEAQALPMGKVVRYWFERMNWRLAKKCHLLIDFLIQLESGELLALDVKARWSNGQVGTDDARVKLRLLAECSPFPVWVAALDRKIWTYEEFVP